MKNINNTWTATQFVASSGLDAVTSRAIEMKYKNQTGSFGDWNERCLNDRVYDEPTIQIRSLIKSENNIPTVKDSEKK